MERQTKGVLFDIGNVLVKLRSTEFLARFCAACPGLDPETLRLELIREDGHHFKYERGEISAQDFHAHLVRAFGLAWTWAEFRHHWIHYFDPNPPMEGLLRALKPQARLWALSNSNDLHFEVFRSTYTVFKLLDGIVGSHEVGLRKPDPRIYRLALERMRCAPADVFYVDDLPANVEGARQAGMTAFHYTFNDEALRRELAEWGLKAT